MTEQDIPYYLDQVEFENWLVKKIEEMRKKKEYEAGIITAEDYLVEML